MNKKQGQYKKGIWVPSAKVEIIKPEKGITLLEVQEAYRARWRARNEFQRKCVAYNQLHNKYLGLDKIDQEMLE